ncbi:MAG: uroporphyrinogen-III synthase [Gammaproteobacteria bacterium]|nr:uroporphyrinogen-III synthase [Gammaproteobacteria bacterium]NNL99857.1 uroporphyrinogen-III synthase [Gammaproteobacteria bacterium]
MGALDSYAVLVTRPEQQAGPVAGRIEAEGGSAILAPMVGIRPLADGAALNRQLEAAAGADIGIFISRNAVAYTLDAPGMDSSRLRDMSLFAVGLGTARELVDRGFDTVSTPRSVFSTEGLLELPALAAAAVGGHQVTIFRGRGGREELAEALTKRGAEVAYCEVYERFVPDISLVAVLAEAGGVQPDITLVTSIEGLTNLADKITDEGLDALFSTPILVPGNRIAAEAEKLGFGETVVVNNPSDARMVEALINWAQGDW